MKTLRKAHLVVLLLVLAMTAACGSAAGDGQSSSSPGVTLGGLFVLSGPIATYGTKNKEGFDLAVQHINEDGGLLGMPVQTVVEDTAFETDQVVSQLRKIAANESVPVIIGPTSTNESLVAASLAQQIGIPFISPNSAGAWDGEFNKYTFRVNLSVDQVLPSVFRELEAKTGQVQTAAIVFDVDEANTASEAKFAEAAIQSSGIQLVGMEQFSTGDRDFGAQISAITREGAPDLIYLSGPTAESALFIEQLRARGITSQVIGGTTLGDESIFDLSRGAAEGVITFFPLDVGSDRPSVQRFVEDYQAAHGQLPEAGVALGYDATMLAADAIRRAGSTDREAVTQALASTSDLQLVDGAYNYDGPGDNDTPNFYLFQMNGEGSFVRMQ